MAQKPQPGIQGTRLINPKTGLEDNTGGDHSLKAFIKMQWDWTLIWLAFFVISIIQLCNVGNIINMISESVSSDGFFGGFMVVLAMIIWIPTLIGMTFFLRDWWLKLCGEKSWNKRIVDKKD